jgi:predicted RNA-binding Zn ribbon-like protein
VKGLPPAKNGGQSPFSVGHQHLDRAQRLLEAFAGVVPDGFEPLRCAVGLELTLFSPVQCPPGDALNFLGGVGDALQRKPLNVAGHLGPIAELAIYENDRQIRRVRFAQRISSEFSYLVRVRTLSRDPVSLDPLPRRYYRAVAHGRAPARVADVCVEFANATDIQLKDYDGLVQWCSRRRTLAEDTLGGLTALADDRSVESSEVLRQAKELRDALRVLLADLPAFDPMAIDVVSRARRRCAAHEKLDVAAGLIVARCAPATNDLTTLLCAVTRSAVTLLGSKLLERVRSCADERCGRFFIDHSRNGTRRWCDMSSCGNRAKQRRMRERNTGRRASLTARS